MTTITLPDTNDTPSQIVPAAEAAADAKSASPSKHPAGFVSPVVTDRIRRRRDALLRVCRKNGHVPTMRQARSLLEQIEGIKASLGTLCSDFHALCLRSYGRVPEWIAA